MSNKIYADINNVQAAEAARKKVANLSVYTKNVNNQFENQNFWVGDAAESLGESIVDLHNQTVNLQEKIDSFLVAFIEGELAQLEDARSIMGQSPQSFYGDNLDYIQKLQNEYPGFENKKTDEEIKQKEPIEKTKEEKEELPKDNPVDLANEEANQKDPIENKDTPHKNNKMPFDLKLDYQEALKEIDVKKEWDGKGKAYDIPDNMVYYKAGDTDLFKSSISGNSAAKQAEIMAGNRKNSLPNQEIKLEKLNSLNAGELVALENINNLDYTSDYTSIRAKDPGSVNPIPSGKIDINSLPSAYKTPEFTKYINPEPYQAKDPGQNWVTVIEGANSPDYTNALNYMSSSIDGNVLGGTYDQIYVGYNKDNGSYTVYFFDRNDPIEVIRYDSYSDVPSELLSEIAEANSNY